MHVVWFKRDLRLHDHAPLAAACEQGSVCALYIVEPELWAQPDTSERHWLFIRESLIDLRKSLQALGADLVIKVGAAVEVLDTLHAEHGITSLWSHQETGNGWTYARDIAIGKWCKLQQVPWHEKRQFGVVRGLASRDGWAGQWSRFMNAEIVPTPEQIECVDIKSDQLPTSADLNVTDDGCEDRQHGGRARGLRALTTFLRERGRYYSREMSSPVTAFMSCSRLSPHLAYGTVSIREVYQALEYRRETLKHLPPEDTYGWARSLSMFSARLRWHCHFIQKLEDEPRLEFENAHRAYDGLRPEPINHTLFTAWAEGRTGYPFVDACMRALIKTGWINFRMRAMLMSFACFHLWLHWRETSLHLARLFTDYEPGIHYNQCQMQAGTTGINTVRIYSPIKQSMDQDPEGEFIKRWVPELQDCPEEEIHTPWEFSSGVYNYPDPIVDEKMARTEARDRIYAVRKQKTHRAEAEKIVKKHASRKRTSRKKKVSSKQQSLPLGGDDDAQKS